VNDRIKNGGLNCKVCNQTYPVVNYIPRFVSSKNYASSFGLQWNKFQKTQLDSHTGLKISHERFVESTEWDPQRLAGKTLLDLGCGSGRFSEVALSFGANVIAVDFSKAVDACWENLGSTSRINVLQADIYKLPFVKEQFEYIYCLGVLQHTPDPRSALNKIIYHLKPNGHIVVDIYLSSLKNLFHPKSWLRPFTSRMSPQYLFNIVRRYTPFLLSISRALSRIPFIGQLARRIVPVANYEGIYPLNEKQLLEWAILDTFDWLSPKYDRPQTPQKLRYWLVGAGLENVDVLKVYHLVGRGQKPINNDLI
jgi:2-polyprenyl-3-methyl-5-hydroxy-6-metoxy-1,4-benzoquinol methylase